MNKLTEKPILVSGATGFLASHCVKQLLQSGYKVRGTVRSLANKDKNKFLYELVPEKSHNLELVEADLLKPETWQRAVDGVDYVLHVASPFVLENIKDENVLIKPAVEGTLNILQACLNKGVKKVVVTSSTATLPSGNNGKITGAGDWSPEDKLGPYPKSKVKAEKAAWKFWEEHKGKIELATVLPGFIVGPVYTSTDGVSEKLIKDMLLGKMPGLPNIHSAMVDVRNVAEVHIKALFSPNSNGKRYVAVGESLWFKEIAQILKDEFGKYGYKVKTNSVPNWVIKIGSCFSKDLKMLKNELGVERKYDNEPSIKELGVKYYPAAESLKEMVYSFIRLGAVSNFINK